MSDTIPLVFVQSNYVDGADFYTGSIRVWVNPKPNARSPDYSSPVGLQGFFYVLILSRADPTGPPAYLAVLSNNTDVPPEMAVALNPKNILFFGGFQPTQHCPQGALYTALMEAGAGAQLEQFERLAYFRGCGMVHNCVYTLVAIPGSGVKGYERGHIAETVKIYGQTTYGAVTRSKVISVDLVPGSDGYVPVITAD